MTRIGLIILGIGLGVLIAVGYVAWLFWDGYRNNHR